MTSLRFLLLSLKIAYFCSSFVCNELLSSIICWTQFLWVAWLSHCWQYSISTSNSTLSTSIHSFTLAIHSLQLELWELYLRFFVTLKFKYRTFLVMWSTVKGQNYMCCVYRGYHISSYLRFVKYSKNQQRLAIMLNFNLKWLVLVRLDGIKFR